MHLYLYIIQWMVSVHLSFSLLPLTPAVPPVLLHSFFIFRFQMCYPRAVTRFFIFLNIFFFVAYAIDF